MRELNLTDPSAPVRLLQITDCHLFTDDAGSMHSVVTRRSMEAVLAAAADDLETAHAVLATGDLSQDETEESYRQFARLMTPLQRPVLCLPGNHDEIPFMQRHLDQGPFQFCGSVLGGNWVIVLLSSKVPGRTGGALPPGELQRLRETLAAHGHRHALVCLHHQPVPIGSAWLDTIGLENAGEFMELIKDAGNVRGVVWGHVHQAYESIVEGLHLMSTPSTCHQFVGGQDDFETDPSRSGYRVLDLFPDGRIDTRVTWVTR